MLEFSSFQHQAAMTLTVSLCNLFELEQEARLSLRVSVGTVDP
jgi:hypothetical protein